MWFGSVELYIFPFRNQETWPYDYCEINSFMQALATIVTMLENDDDWTPHNYLTLVKCFNSFLK